jgi:hypothetical protein
MIVGWGTATVLRNAPLYRSGMSRPAGFVSNLVSDGNAISRVSVKPAAVNVDCPFKHHCAHDRDMMTA